MLHVTSWSLLMEVPGAPFWLKHQGISTTLKILFGGRRPWAALHGGVRVGLGPTCAVVCCSIHLHHLQGNWQIGTCETRITASGEQDD